MNHLTEEQLVDHYYGEAANAAHLAACADCTTQYETLRRVLSIVSEAEVPDPGTNYEERVWNRLRWKLEAPKRKRWQGMLAAAATLALAFFAGQLWRARQHETEITNTVAISTQQPAPVASAGQGPSADRLMFVVVGDHLDSSERMLVEIANGGAATVAPQRAEDLVAANRIYRQTATQRGDERIAELLSDLEPILLEVARAGSTLEGEKLADLQKRIESKGLLFKVRVVSAAAAEAARPAPPPSSGVTSL